MKNRPLLSICLILSGILILWAIPNSKARLYEEKSGLEQIIPDEAKVNLTGIVYKVIEKQSSNAVYLKEIQFLSSVVSEDTTNLIIYVSKETEIHIGNILQVSGQIHYYHLPENPGNFNQKLYYLQQNIEGYVFADQAKILSQKRAVFKDSLCSVRMRWSHLIQTHMSEENGNLLSAMLLGEKQGVDSELKELYQVNGIGHILAVSGLHISLIGISLYQLFRRTTGSYPIGGLVGMIFMIAYIWMIGFSVSAARAFVMFLFRVGADMVGRRYDAPTALGFSAYVLLMINPLYIYDGAFWFSYGAILSILLVLPCFTEKRAEENKKYDVYFLLIENGMFSKEGREKIIQQLQNNLLEALFASISIQVLLLPVQAYFYYEIAPYSILLNLIVIPLMSVIMICGILGSFLGIFRLPGYTLAFSMTEKIFQLYLVACKSMLKIPGARIVTGQPKLWQMILYYFGIAVLYIWYQKQKVRNKKMENEKLLQLENLRKKKEKILEEGVLDEGIRFRREPVVEDIREYTKCKFSKYLNRWKYVIQIPLYFMLLITSLFPIRNEADLELTILSVGQGDCIYIDSPSGLHILVDGGSSSEKQVSKYRIEPFLEYNGVGTLDYVFVTHGDQDHINGISEMLDRKEVGVKIKCLILPPKYLWDESLKDLAEKALMKGTDITCIKKGQSLIQEEFSIECIYPIEDDSLQPGNSSSVVLAVSCKGFDILLTGDLEAQGEDTVTGILQDEKADISWEILKVAHHGSKNSTSEEFLKVVKPQYAIISAGKNNRYGHPHKETIERLKQCGCKIISTQERGAIEVK